MARIIAKGELDRKPYLRDYYPEFDDYQEIIIEGDQYVSKYICDDFLFESFVRVSIKNGSGHFANMYPEPNSMLQAYVFLLMIFSKGAVQVEGKIDFTNDDYDPNVIY